VSLLASDSGFALARCGNAFITFWREPATMARLQIVSAEEQRVVDSASSGIVVLTVVTDLAFRVGEVERKEASRLIRVFEKTTRAHAFVIEGSGFRTAAMRATLASIEFTARRSHPSRIFGTVESAAAWLGPFAMPLLRADELLDAVAEVRAAIGSH
jgi:hypothetical protein